MVDARLPQPVAVVGGTGRLGPGIARHLAARGIAVIVGSRDEQRAQESANSINATLGGLAGAAAVTGATNADACARSQLAVITVPFAGLDETLPPLAAALAGKIVVSTVVPLSFEAKRPSYIEVAAGSAAQRIAELLPGARVAAALHTVSSNELASDHALDADSVVMSDDEAALAAAAELVTLLGIRPVSAGGLSAARYAEQLTVLLLGINRRYRTNSGVRITGLPPSAAD